MIRAPQVNPLLLFLAAQARAQVPASPDDPWRGLGVLRLDVTDPDRSLNRWREPWAQTTRQSFAASRNHGLFGEKTTSDQGSETQPLRVAQSAVQKEGVVSTDVQLLPWKVRGRRYDPGLVDQMVLAKTHGKQVWLDVSAHQVGEAAQEGLIQDGLRLGCSWFLRPPAEVEQQEAYVKALKAWTQQILTDPHFDQWVWPWADVLIKGMVSYAVNGTLPKRQGPPQGWPAGSLRWPQLTREVVEGIVDQLGNEAIARDLFLGLMADFPAPHN